jgi:hypothetical protein
MCGRENQMYTGYLYGNINYALLRMQLTQRSKGFLENLTVTQPIKKFPELYGTQNFHYLFTVARNLPISCVTVIIPQHPRSFILYYLIVSSNLHLRVPSDLFLLRFHTKTLYAFFVFPKLNETLAQLIFHHFINLTITVMIKDDTLADTRSIFGLWTSHFHLLFNLQWVNEVR